MSHRYLALLAIGAVAIAFLPSESQAQFSKLKKSATAAAASAAGVPTSPPRYVDNIDVTPDQVTQVNTGLQAEIDAAPQATKEAEAQQKQQEKAQESYDAAVADYEKKDQKYTACEEKLVREADPDKAALAKKSDAAQQSAAVGNSEEAQIEAQAKAAQAAAERIQAGKGTPADEKTIADFQKTMAAVQSRGMAAVSTAQEASAYDQALTEKIQKTCGAKPVRPTSPSGSQVTATEVIQSAGAKAAGMALAAWLPLREKVIGYAQSNTQVKPGKIPEADANAINTGLGVTRQRVAAMQKANVPI
jgi:hypothetical protein